jgi:Zn-dependent protease with chaperone function
MGFWKWKRICLFDTLLEQCTDEEVLAIMGHELGHWKLGHNTRMMVVGYISAFVNFFLFGFVMNETRLYTDFGFTASQQCVFLGLFLFAQVYQPVSTIVSRYTTARTRAHEFEADSFAVACGLNEDLASGLLAIHHSNLASPTSDPWYESCAGRCVHFRRVFYSFIIHRSIYIYVCLDTHAHAHRYSAWHHSHPPLDERLRAIKHTPASWIRKAAAGVASKLRSTSE